MRIIAAVIAFARRDAQILDERTDRRAPDLDLGGGFRMKDRRTGDICLLRTRSQFVPEMVVLFVGSGVRGGEKHPNPRRRKVQGNIALRTR